jgi:exodeoxyribonuclease-3
MALAHHLVPRMESLPAISGGEIMLLLSWNVNGIRAVYKKGFLEWLQKDSPDILCLQETKATADQIPREIRNPTGYHAYFTSGEKKGYGGVGLLSKTKPLELWTSMDIEGFDDEGRAIVADYGDFILYNVYFPNGKASAERLAYKLKFYDLFLEQMDLVKSEGKGLVICGDINTAHKEIDLARPKQNEKISGFLPEERAWMDKFVSHGFVDTFRLFQKEGGHYSWWDLKSRARERNVGWRIDYFFVSQSLVDRVRSAFILRDVMGSDHCPVGIEFHDG